MDYLPMNKPTTVQLLDKVFEVYLSEDQIKKRIDELAEIINADYEGKSPVILSILNGSFIFTADIVRKFNFMLNVEFVRFSSYHGTTSSGKVKKVMKVNSIIKDKDVLIIEDIIDTGLTMQVALEDLASKKPRSIRVLSLLVKPEALKYETQIDYAGFEIPNEFVVGYGLDYSELGRDLPAIYRLKS